MGYFTRGTFQFMTDLAANNDRQWFAGNKSRYEENVRGPALRLIEDFAGLLAALSPHFHAGPRSLFRIHRDTRFSKDKSPYKTYTGIQFRHDEARDAHAPGYYFHLQPGSVFAGLGVWHPEPRMLHVIRDRIATEPDEWEGASRGRAFSEAYDLAGERLTRPPKGYDADHPLVEDLKFKDFVAVRRLPESFATSSSLPERLAELWGAGSPFMRFLCDAIEFPF